MKSVLFIFSQILFLFLANLVIFFRDSVFISASILTDYFDA